MSLIIGNQKIIYPKDFNEEIKKINGELDDIQAKLTLARFLRQNIGYTIKLLAGIELSPLQEFLIKCILKKDNSLIVAGRGGGKSFIISILAVLYPLFYFNSKMCLISTNFRASRRILEETEKMLNNKSATLLRQCYESNRGGSRDIIKRAPDLYRIKIGDPANSEVFSLPLTEGLRGTRASFVCVDEMLTVTKKMQEEIVRPFLTAKQNLNEENEIRRAEDELIKLGSYTEADRQSFPKNKYCGFSSASYQFEYLYEYFQSVIENIMNPSKKENDPPTFFCTRFSYEALDENNTHLDLTQIKAAKIADGENSDYFKREYRALFIDGSGSYFDVKKLHECTIKNGDYPTTQIKGGKDSEYILAIDPSYSAAKNSDYFAMAVYLLNKDERKITLVHTYGRAGGEIKEHFQYLAYLLTYFNIVFTVIDASGTEFIDGFNQSTVAADKGLKVNFVKGDFDTDDMAEYNREMTGLKQQYNVTSRTFVYPQKFSTSNNAIRRINEYLHNQIAAQKVWFASLLHLNETAFNKAMEIEIPLTIKDNKDTQLGISDFIDQQDDWVSETKNQVALIQVKASSSGTLSYDLPAGLRNLTSNTRPRRDHYTTLLLANWGAKLFFDMLFNESKKSDYGFEPIILR